MPTTIRATWSYGELKADVEMTDDQLADFLQDARLTVVLGVGSELRGDDAAGILVARRLAQSPLARATVKKGAPGTATGRGAGAREGGSPRLLALEGHTAPESFAGKIIKLKPSHVLIVDAAEMGLKPGEWGLLGRDELDKSITSTHLIPLTTLAKHLEDACGCTVGFAGIQTGRCGIAVGVSAPVLLAIDEISGKIVHLVAKNSPK